MKNLFFVLLVLCWHNAFTQKKYIDYVDPFIGTLGHGHTYPGATLPFGMVQLSPDNGTEGWDWCSGYNYIDSNLAGFSHTHLSGTGIGDLCDISVLPLQGIKPDTVHYNAILNHKNEKASPGYYAVEYKQNNNKIFAELTTGRFFGFHQYSFENTENPFVQIDLGWKINWDNVLDSKIEIKDNLVLGYRHSKGWSKNQYVFFAIQFENELLSKESVIYYDKSTTYKENTVNSLAFIKLKLSPNKKIKFKVGISFANIEGAIAALKEDKSWNFNSVKQKAEQEWEHELSKIKAESKDKNILKTFYTALYHTLLAPTRFNDINGNYLGIDKKVVLNSKRTVYSVQSLWDTFRAANPLLTIWQQDKVGDVINSYLLFYEQQGLLPVWDLHFSETNTMTGYHAVPIIADAILKDIKGFDYNKAFEAMLASAYQKQRGTQEYIKYGYLPADKHGWSTTITLEYAFDDWCIAQVAKKLGNEDKYKEFMARSKSFEKLFDKNTNFFRAKNSDGKWLEPFNPVYSEHGFDGQYIEGTAWQHTWFVPHDIPKMIELYGGKERFIKKLDSLFTISSKIEGENASVDISGLIGQYAHGNEPSHHIAYLYNYADAYTKTQDIVKKIMNTQYSANKDGLCGNEDCGQMSAWYVMSAMGFYSVNPTGGVYDIGFPILDKVEINTAKNKFTILVKNRNSTNNIVDKIVVDGKTRFNRKLFHNEIINGKKLFISFKRYH